MIETGIFWNLLIIVLIAPLWNWNELKGEFYNKLVSSNRTFMELKWETFLLPLVDSEF